MQCNHCGEEITGRPVKQGSEYYCSLECANRASGLGPEDEEEGYYEENEIEGLYEEEEQ
jgi:hypothetical protein